MNHPDSWVIIKITGTYNEPLYKVLAGWSGSYLHGTSWQLNSGIVKVEDDDLEHFIFTGHSGSMYKCHKNSYGIRMATAGVWDTMQATYPGQVELMGEKTDWLSLLSTEKLLEY
jgi:hypothetical protein